MDLEKDGYSVDDLWIHDEKDLLKAQLLARFFDNPATMENPLPRPFGVFYDIDRPCYEDLLFAQLDYASEQKGEGNLDELISGNQVWQIS